MKQVTIRMDDEDHEELRQLAFDTRKSQNELILEALKQYLNRETGEGE